MKKAVVLLALSSVLDFAQQQGSFADPRDGKTYKTVKIGVQTWMAENLNYAASSSKCYHDSSAYCKKYGRLYKWETAMKACPGGWHLPSNDEWEVFIDHIDGRENAGTKLKAKSGWNSDLDGKSGNGTDAYGFSALPGGDGGSNGIFSRVGFTGYWWSRGGKGYEDIYFCGRYMTLVNEYVGRIMSCKYDYDYDNKIDLYSVRCLKD